MAKENYIGLAMGLDVSDLRAGIAEANKQIQLANSEFKAASSGMDDWTKSTDGLNAKVKQLDSVLEAQEKKLAGLNAEYKKTVDEQGASSDAARKLEIQINNQQAVVNKTARELENYTDTVKKAESGEIDLENVVLKSGKAVEKAGKQSSEASKDVKDLGDSAEKSGDGFTIAKGAVAGFIANGLTALVGKCADAAKSIFGLAEQTREFRQDMGTLESAFDSAGFSTETATETWKGLYKVFGEDDRAVEAANNISRLADNQKDLDEWVRITTGVWGTYQDALPVESLAESAAETAKVGKITGTFADSLNWSSEAASMFSKYMSEDVVTAEDAFNVALSECSDEQERQKLITDTLTKLYGTAADKYKDTASSVIAANDANADFLLTQAEMGEKIEPITTAVKTGFTNILTSILGLANDGSLDSIKTSIENGFKWFIDTAVPKIKNGFTWIKDNKDEIIAGVAAIGTAFLTWKVVGLITSISNAMKGMTAAQWLLNAAMNANPIGIIVTAIAALVAAFIVLWNKCDWFRNFWIGLWEGIKSAFGATVDWFKSVWETIKNFFTVTIPEAFNSVKEFITGIWDSIVLFFTVKIPEFLQMLKDWFLSLPEKLGELIGKIVRFIVDYWKFLWEFATVKIPAFIAKVIEFVKELPSKIWTWLLEMVQKVKDWGEQTKENAKEGAKNAFEAIKEWISTLPERVKEWFDDTIEKIKTFATDFAERAREGAKEAFENIKTKLEELPEKVKDIGKDIVEGLWNGLKEKVEWLVGKVKGFAGDVIDGFKNGFDSHSPSRLTIAIGGDVGEGLGIGIANSIKSVRKKVNKLRDEVAGDLSGIKTGISVTANTTTSGINGVTTGRNTVINAGQTIYYNGSLSRKELKQLEDDQMTQIKLKLRKEGAI